MTEKITEKTKVSITERYQATKDKYMMKNLEDLESVAEELNRLNQRIRELEKENKFLNTRIQEYEDGFYIIDNDTGLKLNQDEIIRRLNKYNLMLNGLNNGDVE